MQVVEWDLLQFYELWHEFEVIGLGGFLQNGKVIVEEGLVVLIFRADLQLDPGD